MNFADLANDIFSTSHKKIFAPRAWRERTAAAGGVHADAGRRTAASRT